MYSCEEASLGALALETAVLLPEAVAEALRALRGPWEDLKGLGGGGEVDGGGRRLGRDFQQVHLLNVLEVVCY